MTSKAAQIAATLAAQSTPTRPAGPRHLLASFAD